MRTSWPLSALHATRFDAPCFQAASRAELPLLHLLRRSRQQISNRHAHASASSLPLNPLRVPCSSGASCTTTTRPSAPAVIQPLQRLPCPADTSSTLTAELMPSLRAATESPAPALPFRCKLCWDVQAYCTCQNAAVAFLRLPLTCPGAQASPGNLSQHTPFSNPCPLCLQARAVP